MPKISELPVNGAVTDTSSIVGAGGQGGGRFLATALRDYIVNSVNAALSLTTAAPAPLGQTAAPGTATTAARADHVHVRPTATEIGAAAAGHTHDINGITGLSTSLADKAPLSHTHNIGQITNLQTSLDAKLATSARGASNGVASLDAAGKVPVAQLPDGATGGGTATPLSDAVPSALTSTGGSGTSTSASRADHSHPRPTPGDIGAIAASTRGAANGVATLGSDTKVPLAQLAAGAANGLATLGADGKVPAAQLPASSVPSNVVTTDYKAGVDLIGAAYTVVAADANRVKVFSSSTDAAITLSSQPIGTTVRFIQYGGGKMTFQAPAFDVVVVLAYGNAKRSAAQYASVVATVIRPDTWLVSGQLIV